MPRDKRIDAYISKCAPFAQDILNHLRELIHKAIPEVQESLKWGRPAFSLRGNLCYMGGFKAHCAFGFWRGDLVLGGQTAFNTENQKGENAMGSFGRIASLKDLPSDKQLLAYLRKAAEIDALDTKPVRGTKVEEGFRSEAARKPVAAKKSGAQKKSVTAKKSAESKKASAKKPETSKKGRARKPA